MGGGIECSSVFVGELRGAQILFLVQFGINDITSKGASVQDSLCALNALPY